MSEHPVFVEFGGTKTRIGTAYQQQDGGFTLVLGGTLTLGPGQPASSRGGASGAVFPPFGRKRGQPIAGCDLENLEWYHGIIQQSVNDPSKSRFREKNQEVLSAIEAEIVRQGGDVPGKVTPDERQSHGGRGDSYGSGNDDGDLIPF